MQEQSETHSIGVKTAILSLSLLTIMAAAAVSPALAKIGAAFPDVSRTLIKLTLTLPALLIVPFSLFSGWLAARWTPRKVLLTGLVIFCIGGMGGGLARSMTELLVYRAVLGIGVGLLMPLSTSLIADFFDGEQRTKMMGLSGAVSHLGGVVFLIVSGWLACISWRHAFAVYGLAFVSLVLVLTGLPEWQRKAAGPDKSLKVPGGVWYVALLGALMMIAFYAVPTNLALFIENEEALFFSAVPLVESKEALAESIRTGVIPENTRATLAEKGITLSPSARIEEEKPAERWLIRDGKKSYVVKKTADALLVANERLGRPAVAGMALSAMTLAGVISGILLARLMRWFRRFCATATIAMMGAGFLLLGTARSMTMIFAGAICIGLSSGFMMPLLLLKVSRIVTPATRAFAMAIASAGVYLGQFVSPIILQSSGRLFGGDPFRSQFITLAVGLAVATVISMVVALRAGPASTSTEPLPRVH